MSKQLCRVTFDIVPDNNIKTVTLCGDFNGWEDTASPMKPRKNGRFSTTITLQAGQSYQFRYLLDGQHWENEAAADGYLVNEFGSKNSLVKV